MGAINSFSSEIGIFELRACFGKRTLMIAEIPNFLRQLGQVRLPSFQALGEQPS